jgi:GntR family carbon starvation induced transcriptional regulator
MTNEHRVSRATLTTQLEDALRLDIIEGVLRPGLRLRAADLTQHYGVSATPLREALQRLAAQNLVTIDPRLGATVSEISHTDLRDIYFMRELLEGIALERSMERADDEWARHVTDAWNALRELTKEGSPGTTRSDALSWSAAHRAFHEALFESCGSPWLLRFVVTLYDHSERYRMLARSPSRDTLEEHEEIYRGTVARDTAGAVKALRRHLAGTVAALEEGITPHASTDRVDGEEVSSAVAG